MGLSRGGLTAGRRVLSALGEGSSPSPSIVVAVLSMWLLLASCGMVTWEEPERDPGVTYWLCQEDFSMPPPSWWLDRVDEEQCGRSSIGRALRCQRRGSGIVTHRPLTCL